MMEDEMFQDIDNYFNNFNNINKKDKFTQTSDCSCTLKDLSRYIKEFDITSVELFKKILEKYHGILLHMSYNSSNLHSIGVHCQVFPSKNIRKETCNLCASRGLIFFYEIVQQTATHFIGLHTCLEKFKHDPKFGEYKEKYWQPRLVIHEMVEYKGRKSEKTYNANLTEIYMHDNTVILEFEVPSSYNCFRNFYSLKLDL